MNLTDCKAMETAINEALIERRRFTAQSASAIKQYVGKAYRSGWGADNYENFPYKYVTTVAPKLAMYAPTVRVTEGGCVDEETRALEDALKAWMRQSKLAPVLVALAHDVLFDFGCVLTTLEPTPGWQGNSASNPGVIPMWPKSVRVSPRAVFRDPRAVELGGPRFEGHVSLTTKAKMAEAVDAYGQPLYDTEAVAALQDGAKLEELRQDLMVDGINLPDDDRQTVVLYSVFDLETRQACTYAVGGNEGLTLVRKPVEAERKYTFFGVGIVPDQLYPLSPLAVTNQQVEEINRHRRFLSKSQDGSKKLTIINGTDTRLITTVQDAPSGGVLAVAGFNGSVTQIDLGGVAEGTYEFLQFSAGKLDELGGISDIMRGNLKGDNTATEVNEAAAYADSRMTFMREQFKAGVLEMLDAVVDLMDRVETVAFPVTRRNEQGQMVKGTFIGGRDTQEDGWPWRRAMTCEIDPNSMEHVNRAAQQAALLAVQGHVVNTLAAYSQNPSLKPEPMIDDVMQIANVGHGADRYVDFQFLQQAMAAQAQMAAMAMQNQAAGAMPGATNQPTAPAA